MHSNLSYTHIIYRSTHILPSTSQMLFSPGAAPGGGAALRLGEGAAGAVRGGGRRGQGEDAEGRQLCAEDEGAA